MNLEADFKDEVMHIGHEQCTQLE